MAKIYSVIFVIKFTKAVPFYCNSNLQRPLDFLFVLILKVHMICQIVSLGNAEL